MKEYCRIEVTLYASHVVWIWYYKDDNGIRTIKDEHKMSKLEAQKLQWELVRMGAKRIVQPHPCNNKITTVEVKWWE